MKKKELQFLIGVCLSLAGLFLTSCDLGNEIKGNELASSPPVTKLLNVPVQNNIDNPYDAVLKVGWKGESENGFIKGYWVSWTSHYLTIQDSVVREPFFTEEMSLEIPFPSADSLNQHKLKVIAVDNRDIQDPVGATGVYYTKKVIPPVTSIIFPENNSEVYLLDEENYLWKGIRIDLAGTTDFGVIRDYSYKINEGSWSDWKADSTIFLTKKNHPELNPGNHKVFVRARNSAYSFDQNPVELNLQVIKPEKNKEWLIIDDTEDQNGGMEKPDDMQVDQFYRDLFAGETFDEWDIINSGEVTRSLIGNYKYIIWHSDAHRKNNIAEHAGVIIDYLNTGGNLFLTGWNNFEALKSPSKQDILNEKAKFYGDFIKDYAHINSSFSVKEANLHTIIDDKGVITEIDKDKLFFFRKGLYKVDTFTDLKPFTRPLFHYGVGDSTNIQPSSTIGFGYHNNNYKIVVTGFPLYFLKAESAENILARVKEYFETEFPY